MVPKPHLLHGRKFDCGKWRAIVTATTYAKAVPMWTTVNGGLPLLALPFFRVVYVDTDVNLTHMKSQ